MARKNAQKASCLFPALSPPSFVSDSPVGLLLRLRAVGVSGAGVPPRSTMDARADDPRVAALAESLERVGVASSSAAPSAASAAPPSAAPACVTHTKGPAICGSVGCPEVVYLDTAEACAAAMGRMLERKEPVAVDFEGIALSRTGKLCLAQVAPRDGPVYLVDVAVMGAEAFEKGMLGALLESTEVLKLIFDCRNDSDALWHQYAVKLRHVYDVQVVYCLKGDQDNGGRRGRYLSGLRRALWDCPGLHYEAREALDAVKAAGSKLFAPDRGGSYDVWEKRCGDVSVPVLPSAKPTDVGSRPALKLKDGECNVRRDDRVSDSKTRPLSEELMAYAAADVVHLHAMWAGWKHFMVGMNVMTCSPALPSCERHT